MMLAILFAIQLAFGAEAELEADCNKGHGLSCAKLAYQLRKNGEIARAFDFYDKGCKLNDQTSCTNRTSLNPRDLYLDKVNGMMKFNEHRFIGCQGALPIKRDHAEMLSIKTHINLKGEADDVKIQSNFGQVFNDCVKKTVQAISFPPPPGIDPTIDYKIMFLPPKE